MLDNSFSQATVQEIRQDAPSYIVAQLVNRDRVHTKGVGSVNDLRRYRLGGEGLNRACFALVNDENDVASVIYVHKSCSAVKGGRDMYGNVAQILSSEVASISSKPTQNAFYSISTIREVQGAGQKLIAGVHAHLTNHHPDVSGYTLSPLRTFDESWTKENHLSFSRLSPTEQKFRALEYVLTGNDPVTQFHMTNGARPWDVKLGAGDIARNEKTGKIQRHWAMVNYSYAMPAEELKANAEAFRAIKRILRDKTLDITERLKAARAGMLPLVAPELLDEVGLGKQRAGSPLYSVVSQIRPGI